jgi:hypothetical protein
MPEISALKVPGGLHFDPSHTLMVYPWISFITEPTEPFQILPSVFVFIVIDKWV